MKRNWLFKVKNRLFPKKYTFSLVEEVPYNAENGIVYIVGTTNPWLVVFKCPCNCGEIIQLNLLTDEKPWWEYRISRGQLNLFPSVRRIRGCKSHFWIRKGKVHWSYF